MGTSLGVREREFEEAIGVFLERNHHKDLSTLGGEQLKALSDTLLEILALSGKWSAYQELFEDPFKQVLAAVGSVMQSWHGVRDNEYRQQKGISSFWNTAVIVQAYVFGDQGSTSGTGLVRAGERGADGMPTINGEWSWCNQGIALVSGRVIPRGIDALRVLPKVHDDLSTWVDQIEHHLGVRTLNEITVEQGRLWFLQTIRDHAEMFNEAFPELDLRQVKGHERISGNGVVVYGQSGGFRGPVVFDFKDVEAAAQSVGALDGVVVLRTYTTPQDTTALLSAAKVLEQQGKRLGLITIIGGITSHAAVVANNSRIPAIVSVSEMTRVRRPGDASSYYLKGREIKPGQPMTLDFGAGKVYLGAVPLAAAGSAPNATAETSATLPPRETGDATAQDPGR